MAQVYVRETQQAEQRANAREKVATAARNGRLIEIEWTPDELEWAFDGGYEHELAELKELARARHAAGIAQQADAQKRRELKAETDRVLKEWDERDAAERRAKAQDEARSRLGL